MKKNTLLIFLSTVVLANFAYAIDVSWPVENQAFFRGIGPEGFIQPTSGNKSYLSGTFGCVRNNGTKFHEGIDIKPFKRDSLGNPKDVIVSAFPGRIVYINNKPKQSSYGRYVVIEHTNVQPRILTLYAHLSKIDKAIGVGSVVDAATPIGTMGNTASHNMPLKQAHLHFEIVLMLSEDFNSWYKDSGYKSKNIHDIWNGRNLVGIDPLDFYTKLSEGQINSVNDYFKKLKPAFSVRINDSKVPNFIQRNPTLLANAQGRQAVQGWDIDFTWYGMPFKWTPIYDKQKVIKQNKATEVTFFDPEFKDLCRHRKTIVINSVSKPTPSKTLNHIKDLLFKY